MIAEERIGIAFRRGRVRDETAQVTDHLFPVDFEFSLDFIYAFQFRRECYFNGFLLAGTQFEIKHLTALVFHPEITQSEFDLV